MKYYFAKFFLLSILLFSPSLLAAQGLPLGSACSRTADCGKDTANVDLGCRWSDFGKYQICKIVSSGAAGCSAAPAGENWCGDNLICYKNICAYDYLVPPTDKLPVLGQPLGSACTRTADCGKDTANVDLGCRWSDFGKYQICKIVSSGAAGCSAAPAGENWCGDNLICRENKCYYDWEQPPETQLGFLVKIFAQLKFFFTWDNFKTFLPLVINFIISLALITGLMLCLKGYMKRKYCQDFEPDLHQSLKYITIGGMLVILSVTLGIMMLMLF